VIDEPSSLAALERELGAPPPDSFVALGPAELAALADALAAAREHQWAALEEASERGLRFVPRLLRGPVKKVLFG